GTYPILCHIGLPLLIGNGLDELFYALILVRSYGPPELFVLKMFDALASVIFTI
ncbi:MAG: hypothetical protein JRI22_17825, partial [Deltaproteobacteria bacterium]|nr:hypothetical protein [Deltaproteobacteria bacterium]